MGIQKIIDYVMKTPENTNPAVLRSVIKQNTSSSSGGGENLAPFLEGTIESVTIPSDVKTLREGAFYNCTLLKAIDVESGHSKFKAVDGVLYSKDGKTLIAYPPGKKETEFTLPESVTTINGMAFNGSDNLAFVYIHGGVTDMSPSAFYGSDASATLNMDASVLNEGGIYPFNSELVTTAVIPEGTTYVSATTFDTLPNIDTLYINAQCEFEVVQVTLDKSTSDVIALNLMENLKHLIIGGNVTSISPNFWPTVWPSTGYLESLIIGDSVESIGESAFVANTNLKEITLGNSLKTIGGAAFYNCHNLTGHLIIPDSVTLFDYVVDIGRFSDTGAWTFYGCAFTEITIGTGLTAIPGHAFRGNYELKKVTIPSNVTFIASSAFSGCPSDMVICGYVGSAAETFATENNYTFEEITE